MIALRITLQYTMLPALRQTLEAHLYELETIETELYTTASCRGWDLIDMDTALKLFYSLHIHLHMYFSGSTSKIAAFVIRANTTVIITILSTVHRTTQEDTHIQFLSQKILDCASVYIHRLHGYL